MDSTYLLPVFETIQLSWKKVKGSKSTLWGAYGWLFLIAFVLGFTAGILDSLNNPSLKLLTAVLKPLTSLLIVILAIGLVRLGVRRALDQPIKASMVFYPIKNGALILKILGCWLITVLILLPFLLLTFLALVFGNSDQAAGSTGCLIAVGFVAGFSFIITLYVMVRTRLGWAFIVDKELGPWTAIKASFRLTRHNFWRLLGLYFLNAGIVALSLLPLGLGLIWSLPYALINYGQAYRNLLEGQG